MKMPMKYITTLAVLCGLALALPSLTYAAEQCTTNELDLMCPQGQVLQGINPDGSKTCVNNYIDAICPVGEVLQSITSAGVVTCVVASAPPPPPPPPTTSYIAGGFIDEDTYSNVRTWGAAVCRFKSGRGIQRVHTCTCPSDTQIYKGRADADALRNPLGNSITAGFGSSGDFYCAK